MFLYNMDCRFCHTPLDISFIDLGFAPPSNAYLANEDLHRPEVYYPLRVMVCSRCWLVQTEDYAKPDQLFTSDYAYFSSTSSLWSEHARRYVAMISRRLGLHSKSFVVEIGSNDGYLLRHFLPLGISCLGIEPTDQTASAAESAGVPTLRRFFGEQLARELAEQGRKADLIIGNNVYAHVPDIVDFTKGLKVLLKPEGTITLEFPHVLRLIESAQFDTIYHEHFTYLSLQIVKTIFEAVSLRVWDVEELPTHGGSLRVYGCHAEDARPTSDRVFQLISREKDFGLQRAETYLKFQDRANSIKNAFLEFLLSKRARNELVAAYGAAAKGNTLLNYAGVKPDLLRFVVDRSPGKVGKYLPGSHIPVVSEERLKSDRPKYIVILPWNLRDEITHQLSYARAWGAEFVTAVPSLEIVA